MKQKSGSSAPEKRRGTKEAATKTTLSRAEQRQLARLSTMPEASVDTVDIPEAPAENWVHARRGDLYRAERRQFIGLAAQGIDMFGVREAARGEDADEREIVLAQQQRGPTVVFLSFIHISEPTRPY